MNLSKIAIHGVPRSGTTWLGSIFDSSEHVVFRNQPFFSYAFKSYLTVDSSKKEIDDFFNKISTSNDEFITQKVPKEKGLVPYFKKKMAKHVVYKEARYHYELSTILEQNKTVKVIGIVRDPRSVIYSWYNAPKEFDKENWQLNKEWKNALLKNEDKKENFYGYLKWKEVALMFLDFKTKYPEQFYLLNYDDLLHNTKDVTKLIFAFCGISFTEQTNRFIEASKSVDMSNEAYSVYRTKLSDKQWQGALPNEIVDSIEKDLKGTQLEQFLII